MKYSVILTMALIVVWLVWSGHFDNLFLMFLGALSCAFCIFLSRRMRIVDEEGAPVQKGS